MTRPRRVRTGQELSRVAFPLGGIGTGTIGLGGRGQLRDWEIFNRPAKGARNPYTCFVLRAQAPGSPPFLRVLERRLLPPYLEPDGQDSGSGSPEQHQLLGLPRFPEAELVGEYPIAELTLHDEASPVMCRLRAMNPMVPLDPETSGMPIALFEWQLTNRRSDPLEVTLALLIRSPLRRLGGPGAVMTSAVRDEEGLRGLSMRVESDEAAACGTFAVTTTWDESQAHASLAPGWWFDRWHALWDELRDHGRLDRAVLAEAEHTTTEGDIDSVLLVRATPAAGETVTLPVTLSWHVPARRRGAFGFATLEDPTRLQNHYAERWPDAWAVAAEAAARGPELRGRTVAFRDALFSSTLPEPVLDAVSSQMSTVRTNTCAWLAGGEFHAFEGCRDEFGCCPLDCTHVWNYAQAVAHLFPSLERSMRDTDLLRNTRDSGDQAFRTVLPLLDPGPMVADDCRSVQGPCADGQMGTVLKVYREWLLDGDDGWLAERWPMVRKVLEFAWAEWDRDRDGVMEGKQHNTYDIEFYGPNTMTGSLYLAALAAAERMASHLGDGAAVDAYAAVRASGRAKTDEELFNGEYYVQRIPSIEEIGLPSEAAAADGLVRYQYGEGCLSDQLLGQWFARVVGLGPLYEPANVRTAFASIHRHNFRPDLAEHENVQRVYALPGEAGTVLCSWPRGGRPAIPFVYSDEVWTGIEYAVAAGCIYEGLVDEGLEIVAAARSRHAGWNRNPWDEYECGHHYARAMSSWSLLLALSGYSYSAPDAALSFAPRLTADPFRCFFSTGHAWGTFTTGATGTTVDVVEGELVLHRLTVADLVTDFPTPVTIRPGSPLVVS